jgi:excisionase family DNA binding protein
MNITIKRRKVRKWYTVMEAAREIGVATLTIRRWAKSGRLPNYPDPAYGYRRFKATDVLREAADYVNPTRP